MIFNINDSNNIPPFYWGDMTKETITNLSNNDAWQSVIAPYDGYYQSVVITLAPTVAVSTNCAIGCVKNGNTVNIWNNQTPSIKTNVQNLSPLIYFKKGDTIRVTLQASATTGTQVFRVDCWH